MQSQDSTHGTEGVVKAAAASEWAAFLTAKSRLAEAQTQLHRLLKNANEGITCNHKIQPTDLPAL